MIAIKIKNPAKIAASFGECAGDYSESECWFWVGESEAFMLPSPTLPNGAELAEMPVSYSGGNAWTVRHQEAEKAAKAAKDAARAAEDKASFRAYALRLVEKLRQHLPQPHLEAMGYTPAQIRSGVEAEIATLLAKVEA